MAAGAGAMGIRIGGPATYEGVTEDKPWLGNGMPASAQSIGDSTRLVERALVVWLAVWAALLIAGFWLR